MKQKYLKLLSIFVISILLISILIIVIPEIKAENQENKINYTVRGPIRINSATQFTAGNGVVSGDGTPSYPYIISNWEIDGTNIGDCIYIGNSTTKYYTIKDCYLHLASKIAPGEFNYVSGLTIYSSGIPTGYLIIKNITVEYCDSFDMEKGNGITIKNTHHIKLENISSSNNTGNGIEIIDCNAVDILNSRIKYNQLKGIEYKGNINSAFCDIKNNTIYNNLDTGLNFQGNYKNSISYNNIFSNGIFSNGAGAIIYSERTNISNNIFYNNPTGLHLLACSNNTMFNNTIQQNTLGLNMAFSTYNLIYYNRFINNTENFWYNFNDYNIWNNTYENGGGNYWSDYKFADVYSGPEQNETGSDGYGDTPLSIGNTFDYYPVVDMVNWPKLTKPTIIYINPLNASINVTIDLEIFVIKFSEQMNTSSGNIDTSIPNINFNWSIDGTWYNGTTNGTRSNVPPQYRTFDLSYNTEYYVNLTDFENKTGTNADNFTFLFKTEDGLLDEDDLTLPELFNLTITPNPSEYNNSLNFTVVVTDNIGVDSVYINITGLGNYSMSEGLNNEWYLEMNITLPGINNVTVWANDTSNNWNYTIGSFTMSDEIIPTPDLTLGQILYYTFIGILTLIIFILIIRKILETIKKSLWE